MQNPKIRRIALAVLILIPIVAIGWYFLAKDGPLPDNSTFTSNVFSFSYPRAGALKEYSAGAVAIGNEDKDEVFTPLVDVVRYRSDLDVAAPPSFEAFAKKQALFLCGSDADEQVTCSNASSTAYTSPNGYQGLKIAMTITRKNLKSGTTTAATFEPIYAFNTTPPAKAGEAVRYEGVFVHHSLSAVLSAAVSPELLDLVVNSLRIPYLDDTGRTGGAQGT
jgi:hypothetical protein